MSYMGDFLRGQTVRRVWTTNAGDGARINLSAALAGGDVFVLKDGNATALAATGLSVVTSLGSRVAVHTVTVDTAANAEYTAGSDYSVVVAPVSATVDSRLITSVILEFSIENRPPNLETLPPLSVGAHPLLGILDSGTATATTTTSITLRVGTGFTADNVQRGSTIIAEGQSRTITGYVASTRVATVDPAFSPALASTPQYLVMAGAPGTPNAPTPVRVLQINETTVTGSGTTADPFRPV